MIVTVGNPQAGQSRGSLETWIAVVAVLGPAPVLCVLGARVWSGSVSAMLLALVSGALCGVFAALGLAIVAMVVATVALARGAGAVHRPDGGSHGRRIT